MYICLCKAINETQVRGAIASGIHDVEELGTTLGVGTGCGTCRDHAQGLIDEHLGDRECASFVEVA